MLRPILVLMLCLSVLSLHIHEAEQSYNLQTQLSLLKKQQKILEDSVTKISLNLDELTRQLADSSNDTEKVLMLENSISSERRQLHNISVSILPQFNFSRCSCENLTEEQKVSLLKDMDWMRDEIVKLKNMFASRKRSPQIDAIREDMEKQLTYINSMKDVLNSKCLRTVILSPTIFQTNLYAPNWILGNQTANQVVDEYYERSLRYDNVTNCPIDKPFFNGQACIVCQEPRPVFNLFERRCVSCGDGFAPNNVTKMCDLIPIPIYYTNYNDTNYSLEGLPSIPPKPADAVGDCPLKQPFFNGKKCIQCYYPLYFSVPNEKCQSCPQGSLYDINTKNCQKVERNALTRLGDILWVTRHDNYYNVLSQRQSLLNRNKSVGLYHLCPEDRPFYDNIACIQCKQPRQYFNIHTLRCVAPGKGEVFNMNIHQFVIPLKNYQTMVGAINIIATSNITDIPELKKCLSNKPYFDGLSCIECRKPLYLFDVQAKKCTKCQQPNLYDRFQLRCTQCTAQQKYNTARSFCQYIPVSLSNYEADNYVNLTESIQTLREQNAKKVEKNPNAKVCPIYKPYFNGRQCISCPKERELFNATSLMCTKCLSSQIYVRESRVCEKYYPESKLTNFDAGNIIGLTSLLEKLINDNQKVIESNPKATVCPVDTPYAVGNACISCSEPTPLFDFSTKKCTACRPGEVYSPSLHRCQGIVYLTNLNVENIVNINDTMDSLQAAQRSLLDSSTRYKVCDEAAPFATHEGCMSCKNIGAPLFDYKLQKCTSCKNGDVYDKRTYKCQGIVWLTDLTAANIVNLTQSMDSLQSEQQSTVQGSSKYKVCPSAKPYASERGCIGCIEPNKLFNFTSKKCTKCLPTEIYSTENRVCQINYPAVLLTNLQAGNIINIGSISSLEAEQQKIQASNPKATVCSSDTPYATSKQCISCGGDTPLFDYAIKKCAACRPKEVYNNITYKCERQTWLTNLNAQGIVNLNDTYENVQRRQQSLVDSNTGFKVCSDSTPYAAEEGCINCQGEKNLFDFRLKRCTSCSPGQVYNSKMYECQRIVMLTNLDAPNLVDIGKDLSVLQQEQRRLIDSSPRYKVCPIETPYFNNRECIKCQAPRPLFSYFQKICAACRGDTWYNYKTHKCQYERPMFFLTDLTTKNLMINASITQLQRLQEEIKLKEPDAKLCPPQKPYSIGPECIECTPAKPYFEYASSTCAPCSNVSYFNPKKGTCDKISLPLIAMAQWSDAGSPNYNKQTQGYVTNLNANNLVDPLYPIDDIREEYSRTLEKTPNIHECSLDKPYSTGLNCISCPARSPYFNLTSHRCTSCPIGFVYNSTILKCRPPEGNALLASGDLSEQVKVETPRVVETPKVEQRVKYISNLNNPNWIVSSTSATEIYSRIARQKQTSTFCPKDKPFLINGICQSCPRGTIYNFDTQNCERCPPGTLFDMNTHTCVKEETSYARQTNPNTAHRLILGGISLTEHEQNYERNKRNNRGIKDCPADKPFFDGTVCIECTEPLPYFNLVSKICQPCRPPQIYNSKTKECENTTGKVLDPTPTLSKVLMSIL